MNKTKKQRFLACSLKSNKKGDITITILVVGIFVVCTLALITFFLTSLSVSNDYVDVGLMEKVSIRMEKEELLSGPDEIGSYFLKESKLAREHWYSLTKTKEVFYVKYRAP